jgi:peptide chain release factor subunit 1
MLTTEYGTASNIKSRVNRLSVLSAITSTQQKLKLYNRVPDNGLCVFVGTVLNEEGKEKKISFALEPFKPINTYVCALAAYFGGHEWQRGGSRRSRMWYGRKS